MSKQIVTQLQNGWTAAHDDSPGKDSLISLEHSDYGEQLLPFWVMYEFVVERVRANRITRLKNANWIEVLEKL